MLKKPLNADMYARDTLRLSPENQQILNSKYHKKLLELEWEQTNVMHTQKVHVYCYWFLKAKCFPATAELPKHGFHNVFFLKNVILRTFITCNRLYTTGRCLIG